MKFAAFTGVTPFFDNPRERERINFLLLRQRNVKIYRTLSLKTITKLIEAIFLIQNFQSALLERTNTGKVMLFHSLPSRST
jgi:hypothetical protein